MQKIIDSIHFKYAEMSDLRAREIRVDKQQRKVFCTLSYPGLENLDRQMQKDIAAYVKTLVPKSYSATVSFVNDRFTELELKHYITGLLKKRYPLFSVMARDMTVTLGEREARVVFYVNASMRANIDAADLINKLTVTLNEYTVYNVSFEVEQNGESTAFSEISEQEKLVGLAVRRELLKPLRYFGVSNVQKHIGKAIVGSPMYIADIRKPAETCVLCGKISGKTLKASKKDPNMYVCKFTLGDASGGSVNCVMFARFQITDVKAIKDAMGKGEAEAQTLSKTRALSNERKLRKLMDLYEGMEILVRGRIAFNAFSEQLEMTVYDVSKCKILPMNGVQQFNKPVAERYDIVKPQAYDEYLQTSFVNQIIGQSLISNKTLAVLHVNATGFNAVKDKIYSVCAVKVVDGHLTESFFSYVNPETDIDGIDLDKVEASPEIIVFSPTITEIIADLYKFTYECDLVGTNLYEILNIVNYYASPVGYQFTNECIAQSDLLSNMFDDSVFTKKPNCSRLEDVAKCCKVPFENLNFSYNSAMTVARSLAVLANKVK